MLDQQFVFATNTMRFDGGLLVQEVKTQNKEPQGAPAIASINRLLDKVSRSFKILDFRLESEPDLPTIVGHVLFLRPNLTSGRVEQEAVKFYSLSPREWVEFEFNDGRDSIRFHDARDVEMRLPDNAGDWADFFLDISRRTSAQREQSTRGPAR